jgi:hypothetical protein
VAKSNSGKWVSRVGAAGGGKTYRKARPANYYGILAVIVILGLVATVYSRYEYQNPVKKHAAAAVAPKIGSVLYAGLSIQACGKTLPYLTSDPTTKGQGFVVGPYDVLDSARCRPTPGNNATLEKLANEYPGLTLSKTEMLFPRTKGAAEPQDDLHERRDLPDRARRTPVRPARWSTPTGPRSRRRRRLLRRTRRRSSSRKNFGSRWPSNRRASYRLAEQDD